MKRPPKVGSAPWLRRARFVAEYLVDLNITAASKRSGVSVTAGRNWMDQSDWQQVITEARAKLVRKIEVTAEKVVQELALIGFANMADYISEDGSERMVDLSKLTRCQAAAIQELTVETYTEGRGDDAERIKRTKFKLGDKKAALDSLGRHLGLFEKDQNFSGHITVGWEK